MRKHSFLLAAALVLSPEASLAANVVCPEGAWEDHAHRWEYSTKHSNIGVGDQLFQDRDSDNAVDADEAYGWVLVDYGSGTGNGLVLIFESAVSTHGWFDSGATLKNVAATGETVSTSGSPVGTRVFACETNSGVGYTTASEVIVSPLRVTTTDEPDLKQLLEIAWFYWVDNPLLDYQVAGGGFSNGSPGGRIRLDSQMSKLTATARLNLRAAAVPLGTGKGSPFPIDIDLGGGTIALNPGVPTSATAPLTSTLCDADSDFGTLRVVTNAASFDDVTVGTSDSPKTITNNVGADTDDDGSGSVLNADACDGSANAGSCDWGTSSRVITTSTAHAFSAGLPDRNGDVVMITGSSDADCNKTFLVKHVKDADEFIITAPNCTGANGSVELADVVAECNGHTFVPGFVGINLGGKNDPSASTGWVQGVTIRNARFHFPITINRAVAIRADSFFGSGFAGGISELTIDDIYGAGSGDRPYGHILVDLGKGDFDLDGSASLCNAVKVRARSDNFGTSHQYTVQNLHCSDVHIEVNSRHGGGVRIGSDSGAMISPVELTGSIDGVNDGPGLWVGNAILNIRNMSIGGDANAGSAGSDRGLTAILGTATREARITATGVLWSPGQLNERNECATFANNVHMEQHGGAITLVAPAEESDPQRAQFCFTSGHTVRRFALYGLRVLGVGTNEPARSDYVKEVSAPTYAGLVCPNCVGPSSTFTTGLALGVEDDTAPIGTGCLQLGYDGTSVADELAQGCGTAATNPQLTILPLTGLGIGTNARPWIHSFTCAQGASTASPSGWLSGDSVTMAVKVNDWTTQETLRSGIVVLQANFPIFTKVVNRAPLVNKSENAGVQLEITSVVDTAGSNNLLNMGCGVQASRLVPF